MKKKMSIDPRTNYPTAPIRVTLKDFNAVGHGGGCSNADFTLAPPDTHGVKITKIGGQYVITVQEPVYLEFNLAAVLGYAYIPLCIGFAEKRSAEQAGQSDTFGYKAFPQRTTVDDKSGTKVLRVLDALPPLCKKTVFDF